MINKIILLGNLGQDPEAKISPTGVTVCKFSVATSEKRGENTITEWHNVVCFGKLAEVCEKYLSKGKQVFVEGKIQSSKWTNDAGEEKRKTEVIATLVQFLGGGERKEPNTMTGQQSIYGEQQDPFELDEIPF